MEMVEAAGIEPASQNLEPRPTGSPVRRGTVVEAAGIDSLLPPRLFIRGFSRLLSRKLGIHLHPRRHSLGCRRLVGRLSLALALTPYALQRPAAQRALSVLASQRSPIFPGSRDRVSTIPGPDSDPRPKLLDRSFYVCSRRIKSHRPAAHRRATFGPAPPCISPHPRKSAGGQPVCCITPGSCPQTEAGRTALAKQRERKCCRWQLLVFQVINEVPENLDTPLRPTTTPSRPDRPHASHHPEVGRRALRLPRKAQSIVFVRRFSRTFSNDQLVTERCARAGGPDAFPGSSLGLQGPNTSSPPGRW